MIYSICIDRTAFIYVLIAKFDIAYDNFDTKDLICYTCCTMINVELSYSVGNNFPIS